MGQHCVITAGHDLPGWSPRLSRSQHWTATRGLGPRRRTTPLSNQKRWVYQARISPDEKRAYVSYHGGMDWVDLATGAHCVPVKPSGRFYYGCNSDVHAAFDFVGDEIVAADGLGVQVLDANGSYEAVAGHRIAD